MPHRCPNGPRARATLASTPAAARVNITLRSVIRYAMLTHSISTAQASGANLTLALPSFQEPFIFFHIDKTSGSTFESYIHASAQRLGLLSLVACLSAPCWFNQSSARQPDCVFRSGSHYTPMLCEQPKFARASVFAGHFNPDLVQLLHTDSLSPGLAHGSRWQGGIPSFRCVTFLREPLSRAISWYHDKLPVKAELLPFGNMSMQQRFDLFAKYRVGSQMVAFLSARQSEPSLPEAKAMLHSCVFGLLERLEDSYAIISSMFPWLALPVKGKAILHSHRHTSSHISIDEISTYHQAILRQRLALDVELYEHALLRFENQV